MLLIMAIIGPITLLLKIEEKSDDEEYTKKLTIWTGASVLVFLGSVTYIVMNVSQDSAWMLIVCTVIFSIVLSLFLNVLKVSKELNVFIMLVMSLVFINVSLMVFDKYEKTNVPSFSNDIAKVIKYITPVGHYNMSFVDIEDDGKIKLKTEIEDSLGDDDVKYDLRTGYLASFGLDSLSMILNYTKTTQKESGPSPIAMSLYDSDVAAIQNASSSDIVTLYKGETGYIYKSKVQGKWYEFLIYEEGPAVKDIRDSNQIIQSSKKEIDEFFKKEDVEEDSDEESNKKYRAIPIFDDLLPIDSEDKADKYMEKFDKLIRKFEKAEGGYGAVLINNSDFNAEKDKRTSLEYRMIVSMLNNGNNSDSIGSK